MRMNRIVHFIRPERGPTEAELEARWREIPLDTRDLTARILGDPLPGRDALSKLSSANGRTGSREAVAGRRPAVAGKSALVDRTGR